MKEAARATVPDAPGAGVRFRWTTLAAVLVVIAAAPPLMPDAYWLRIYSMAGVYVMLALGLNIVAGFAGLLDLAYVAFFGIGAYTFALLSSDQFGIHLPFWVVLPLAALSTTLCGFALGSVTRRLTGDYLAIVTLAFAQIFKLLLLNLDRPIDITGGVNGIYGFDPIRIGPLRVQSPAAYAYLIWIAAALTAIGAFRLKSSRYGRGWESIREDETAAAAMGVDTVRLKLYAFAAGACVAGATGAIFASFQDSVFPNNFDFPQLVVVYCMVILGGSGNIPGVISGAVLLSVLPEFLRAYGAYRMMTYGLILVVLMALRPRGLLGGVAGLAAKKTRPDRDTTGVLKASTDLYYEAPAAGRAAAEGKYRPTNREILVLNGVSRDFGGIAAVADLSVSLREQEILAVIGPNGAGKTTVFNLISGIYPPTGGVITFGGVEISGKRPPAIARLGILRTFQNIRLFNHMSVLDNVRVGRFCRMTDGFFSILFNTAKHRAEEAETDRLAREYLQLFGKRLTGYRYDQEALFLSYANRRRLEIARALGAGARVLLLDEPAAGMNPQETAEITGFIKRLRDDFGYTILLIEHKLGVVRNVSDRVIVLDAGEKIAEGDFDQIACDQCVIESYLGRKRS